MKRLAILFVGLACLGADWPQKGDTVYVPGELTGTRIGVPPLVQLTNVSVPACAPLEVAFNPKPTRLYVQDSGRSASFRLCEGWSEWVVKTRDACTNATQITLQKKDGCYAPAH